MARNLTSAATPLPDEFTDPERVARFDERNPYGPGDQPDLYVGIAAELGARTVLELGAGTGLVSRALLDAGFDVVAVEPSPGLAVQGRRRCPEARWIVGYADAATRAAVDLAVLPGHVAQLIVDDDEWRRTLVHLRRSAHLAFEVRDPAFDHDDVGPTPLRFRTEEELRHDLAAAGYDVDRVDRTWRPTEMVVVASRHAAGRSIRP